MPLRGGRPLGVAGGKSVVMGRRQSTTRTTVTTIAATITSPTAMITGTTGGGIGTAIPTIAAEPHHLDQRGTTRPHAQSACGRSASRSEEHTSELQSLRHL